MTAALISFCFSTLMLLPFFFDIKSAGFIYTGDIYHSWMPQLMKSYSLMSHGIFSAIDYSTHSGASEFFLRPNMIIYHPLLIAWSLVGILTTTSLVSAFLILALYLHFFIGCYFTIKLAREHFGFDAPVAVLVAVMYVFSLYAQRNMGFPPFIFISTLFPVTIYAGLHSMQKRSLMTAFMCSAPIFLIFLCGYIALSIASAFFASVFILLWVLAIKRVDDPLRSVFYAILPFAIATVIAAPYYVAVFANHIHSDAHSALNNVFASAHQLAENPRTILRVISEGIIFVGKLYEQSAFIGIVPLAIIVLVMGNSWMSRSCDKISIRSILFNTISYSLFILLSYGTFSVLSDMFFYLVPGVGSMHIYQRFLIFGQLSLAIVCGHMLQMFLKNEASNSITGKGHMAAFLALAMCVAALFLNLVPDGHIGNGVIITDALVFDLFVAFLLFAVWHFTNSTRVFIVLATIAIFLIPANRAYDFESDQFYDRGMQGTKHMEMNLAHFDTVARFLGQDLGKSIVRIYNSEPGVTEAYSSLNLPWFLLPYAKVSDYQGYDFSLAQPSEYRRVFPVFLNKQGLLEFQASRSWLDYSGADFIIYKPSTLKDRNDLTGIIDVTPSQILPIGPDLALAPTVSRSKYAAAGKINRQIDNGYFRLESADSQARMENFKTNAANYFKTVVRSSVPATLHYLFWKNKHLNFYIDGKKVEPVIKDGLYVSIPLPSGEHEVKVRYSNMPINVFLVFYFVYVMALVVLLLRAVFPAITKTRVFSLVGHRIWN